MNCLSFLAYQINTIIFIYHVKSTINFISAYQKTIMAMSTRDPTHSRNTWYRISRWSCRGQTYHSFTIRSRASYSLACIFANQQAIARTPNILSSRRSIFDWSSFITGRALNYMLLTLSCNVNHSLK